jgi:antitoxin ParD1/3/4
MATSTLNISLPETMRLFVEEKINNGGYGTISEYVRELIRADQRREQLAFDQLIREAFDGGEAKALTKADIDEARAIVKKRIAARKEAK